MNMDGRTSKFVLPNEWRYTPIGEGGKAPIGNDWQNSPMTIEEVGQLFGQRYKGRFVGAIGALCGPVSNGLLFVDHDGESCDNLIQAWGELPPTWVVSSGRTGHYQAAYRVSPVFWDAIQTRKFRTGQLDGQGKHEQLELRWVGCQSLVYGTHPETGNQYQWYVPTDDIADAPMWLIEKMLKPELGHNPREASQNKSDGEWSDRDWALSYLDAIDPNPLDWYTWRDCLFGAHQAGLDENEAVDWSRRSHKHDDGGFSDVWRHIKGSTGNAIGLGTLGFVAKQNGWSSPFKKDDREPSRKSKPDPASVIESEDWDEFQSLVTKLVTTIENPLEQEFRLRKLCQSYGMPITFGQQVKQLVTGSIRPFEPMWVEDFLAKNTEDRQWIIASHIPLGTVMDICAAGGSGKTTLLYDWCKHIVLGEKWNHYRTRQGKVLIVQDDEPEPDAREKLDIAKFYDLPPRQCAITFEWQFTALEQLERYIEKENIMFCVIDSLGSTNIGFDRDKPEFANNLKNLRNIANRLNCTFAVLDHTNKGGSQLGTVAVRNTVSELCYLLHPTEDEKRMYDLTRNHRILWYDKSRAGLTGSKFVLEQEPLEYSWKHLGLLETFSQTTETITKNILELVEAENGKHVTVSTVRNEFNLDYQTAELELEQLRRSGMVDSQWVIHGSDRYRVYFLTSEGEGAPTRQKPHPNRNTNNDWNDF